MNSTIFGEKVIENKMCVLIIFPTNLCQTFLILRRPERDDVINICLSSRKLPAFKHLAKFFLSNLVLVLQFVEFPRKLTGGSKVDLITWELWVGWQKGCPLLTRRGIGCLNVALSSCRNIMLQIRHVRKFAKRDYWLRHICTSVRSSLSAEHLGSHRMDFHENWYFIIFRKSVEWS